MFNFSMMSSTAGRVSAKEVVEIAQYSNLTGIEWINSHGASGKELKKLVEKGYVKRNYRYKLPCDA